MVEKPGEKIGIQTAVQYFLCAWEHVSVENILDGWSIYIDDSDDQK